MTGRSESTPFTVERDGLRLAGESVGEGPAVLLLHGLTATRGYVVHGSRLLARQGYRELSYDARGHGESSPAPAGSGYGYEHLSADLGAVIGEAGGEDPVVLAGHSMGSHTAVSYALDDPDRIAALVLIGPVYMESYDEEVLEAWDRLAEAWETGGVDGFVGAVDRGLAPQWRDSILRFTRARMLEHRHPEAIGDALREVPRSRPFDTMSELQFLDVPTLVVASHDLADPRHPYGVAEAYAGALPDADLVSEEEGESPLAWQGGRLSREIAAFCSKPRVRERLGG